MLTFSPSLNFRLHTNESNPQNPAFYFGYFPHFRRDIRGYLGH